MTPRMRYRLASHDLPLLRSPTAPEGNVDACAWIARSLLWVAGWVTGGPHDEIEIRWQAGEESGRSIVRCMRWSRHDLDRFEGASALALALALPEDLAPRRLKIWLNLDGRWRRWTTRRGAAVAPDLLPFLDELVLYTPSIVLGQIESFLIDRAAEHGLAEESEDGLASDSLLSRNLASLRSLAGSLAGEERDASMRPRGARDDAHAFGASSNGARPQGSLQIETSRNGDGDRGAVSSQEEAPSPAPSWAHLPPSYYGDPRSPFGLCLDRFLVLDEEQIYLQGWCLDLERQVESFRLVPEDGESVEVRERLVATPRTDVVDVYTHEFGKVVRHDMGFLGVLPYRYSRRAPRPRFELRFRDGRTPLLAAPGPPILDPFLARHYVFFSLPDASRARVPYLEASITDALEALRPRCVAKATEEMWVALDARPTQTSTTQTSTTQTGTPQTRPEVSVLVPLRNLDLVEPLLAILSDDASFVETAEVIFALDDVHRAAELERHLVDLARLYRLPPLRVLAVRRRAGLAASLHAAAARSGGRHLLFLHDDVVPRREGWLPRLLERKRALDADVLGARLLFEDGSIQSDGVVFVPDETSDDLWTALEPLKGLPPSLEPRLEREVAAVSGACLLIGRALYHELGGLARAFAVGDGEDWDLCLRVRAAGGSVWSSGAVELVHLEGQSKPHAWGWARNVWTALYNRWLLDRRHRPLLEALAAADGAGLYDSDAASDAAREPGVDQATEPLAARESGGGAPAEVLAEAGGDGLR